MVYLTSQSVRQDDWGEGLLSTRVVTLGIYTLEDIVCLHELRGV